MRLLHQGVRMNIKKIRRLMKKYRLVCPIRKPNPYKAMLRVQAENKFVPNLLNRNFKAYGARKVLLTDITYLFYANRKVCYLSAVTDAYTNQNLAYVLSESLAEDFILKTIDELITNHGISLSAETLIHSDQGSHYRSIKFAQLINDAKLRRSMSRKANCWDNAPQESFFGHMKDEIDISKCRTFEEVSAIIDDWIDYYNNERYQWGLARLSPNQFYEYIVTGEYPIDNTVKMPEQQ